MNTKDSKYLQTANFVNMASPDAVLEEVKYNFVHNYKIEDFEIIRDSFSDFLDLFEGRYPGYRNCNTPYHNIHHSTDTFLVFSRILDGFTIEKEKLPLKLVQVAHIAILFHDSGYIQKYDDSSGTGAKHSQVHEKKSIEFVRSYFKKIGLERDDFAAAKTMIQCTDLKIKVPDIEFSSDNEKLLGYMVGTADLVGQMAERTYLEKLSSLYKEFEEGNIPGFESEYDLLQKTLAFYDHIAKKRFDETFDGVYKYARVHFRERYHIDAGLYMDAIIRQLNYLRGILNESSPDTYSDKLRRK